MKTKKGGEKNTTRSLKQALNKFWRKSIWYRILLVLGAIAIFLTSTLYGVAQWYIHKHNSEPLILGTTFIPDYAESFGLDPHQTLNAVFSDLGMRHVRLVSYWSDIEPKPGVYDFSKLDWQLSMANHYGAKVSLAIGMRQPRWPECHEPSWVNVDSNHKENWQPQLNAYMSAVIEHVKNNPAIESYQLENEFFMKVFGQCKDFSRDRLVSEFNMTKKLDPNHPVYISRSNNWVGIPIGKPTPDKFTISVYKRVWDATITHRYFEYPQPAWTYASLAGSEELFSGRDMQIHELQAEPWPPNNHILQDTPLKEQYKSIDAERMEKRIKYGEATGMRTIDLWGVEWWYWLKSNQHDPSVWNTVKDAQNRAVRENQKLLGEN
jgi:hypothetical protein